MTFDKLGLSKALLSAVETKGYKSPSPIQAKAIPAILKGQDVLAAAQTGTGKTAGFTLPLLQKLAQTKPQGRRIIRALIVTPTRELAAQVRESVETYGKNLSLKSAVIFGGVPINPQKNILRKGVDILIATPGRLLDLQNQKEVDLSKVEVLVLDEADRMLDMGFIHDIKRILKLLPKKRQNLLFSATFSDNIRKLASGFMNNPISVDVAPRNTAAENVEQYIYEVEKKGKADLLKYLIKKGDWKQVLVFTRTKHGANRLVRKLGNGGINGLPIHGNKSQAARTKALENFKNGRTRVLVATDIAARGLDIEELPWVVNFDLPNVAEDYVHRIGRTGRAGKSGKAISFVSPEEFKLLLAIEKLLKKSIPVLQQDKVIKEKIEPDSVEKPDTPVKSPRSNNNTKSSRDNKRNHRRKPKPKTDKPTPEVRKKETTKTDSNNQKSKSKPQPKKKKNTTKSVPFSKAAKGRKPGKKGPFGYGMYPLD